MHALVSAAPCVCMCVQVREQAAWFWAAPEGGPSAEDIRAGMGDLAGIRCVAKYAARMGQCFSSTVDAARLAVRFFAFPGDMHACSHALHGLLPWVAACLHAISSTLNATRLAVLPSPLSPRQCFHALYALRHRQQLDLHACRPCYPHAMG